VQQYSGQPERRGRHVSPNHHASQHQVALDLVDLLMAGPPQWSSCADGRSGAAGADGEESGGGGVRTSDRIVSRSPSARADESTVESNIAIRIGGSFQSMVRTGILGRQGAGE